MSANIFTLHLNCSIIHKMIFIKVEHLLCLATSIINIVYHKTCHMHISTEHDVMTWKITLSSLLALCEGNPRVTFGLSSQRASYAELLGVNMMLCRASC